MEVRVADPDHPIIRGLEDFTIEDECYVSEYFDRDSLHILLTAHHEGEGLNEPSCYLKTPGRGRLFYTALGHNAQSIANPHFQRLLARGLAWAAGRDPQSVVGG